MKHPLNSILDKVMKDLQEGLAQYAQEVMKESIGAVGLRQFDGKTGFDSYMVLGLAKDSSDDEVRRRFRELARVLHPDTSRCQGTEFLFMLVSLSYEQIGKERGWR